MSVQRVDRTDDVEKRLALSHVLEGHVSGDRKIPYKRTRHTWNRLTSRHAVDRTGLHRHLREFASGPQLLAALMHRCIIASRHRGGSIVEISSQKPGQPSEQLENGVLNVCVCLCVLERSLEQQCCLIMAASAGTDLLGGDRLVY
jgi:hypothetical protein